MGLIIEIAFLIALGIIIIINFVLMLLFQFFIGFLLLPYNAILTLPMLKDRGFSLVATTS